MNFAWIRSSALALVALSIASSGCFIVRDGHHDDDYEDDDGEVLPRPESIAEVGIDEGAVLDADPGAGVGVFVEYEGAGRWRVWTTCDTEVTGAACDFDMFAEASGLDVIASEDLEGDDELEERDNLVRASFLTGYDTDGVLLDAAPGAALRLEVWLDGQPEARFTYWAEGGIVRAGAPTNPVDFVPQ